MMPPGEIGRRRLCKAFLSGVIVSAEMLLLAGCGYRFSTGGQFPKGIRTVYVASLVNKTMDVGLEKEMAAALESAFRRGGAVAIVDELEGADAILTGAVRTFETRVVAVNDQDEVLEYETIMVADVNFHRRSPDEVLWRSRGSRWVERYSSSRGAVVTSSTEFQMGSLNESNLFQFQDIQLTETLGRRARTQLIHRSASDIYRRIVELF